MDSDGLHDVLLSKDEQTEHSETTVEIKIKTLDSQTYTLRVDKFMPVPALKEQIATVTGVLSEQQRLICRGKVLKDDQLLSAYHVEDGHTLHLVVRQPTQLPFSSTSDLMRGSGSSTDASASDVPNTQERSGQVAHSVVLGTFNIGNEGDGQLPNINRIVSAVLGSIGIGRTGAGTEIIDPREDAERRSTNSAGSAPPDIAGSYPEQSTSRAFLEPVHGILRLPPAGVIQPTVIPDSLMTLSLYLTQMRQEFITNGIHGSGSQEPDSGISSGSRHGGLPTPESLADVMLSSRAMLVEQAGELLSELATQLGDQRNVIDSPARMDLQSNAMRTGAMLQNLGAFLLELGRTTMTLRMGTAPSEAVVNAGPAVFISTSGPNPIMVQPLPFQPGTSFGGHVMASGTLGSGFIPRNIDIRIRTGSNSVPSSSANFPGEPNRVQLLPGQSDSSRNSSVTAPGIVAGASLGAESGVRVVPIRTVVAAVPTSVARPPPFDTTGGALGIFYPLGRFQHLHSGNLGTQGVQPFGDSTSRGSQTDRHVADRSSMQQRSSATLGESSARGILPTFNGPSTHLLSPLSGLVPSTSSVTHQGLSPNNNTQQQCEGNTRNSTVNRNNGTHEEHNPEEPFRNIRSRFDEFLQTLFQGEHMNANIETSTNDINNNNNNDNDGDSNVEHSSSMHLSQQTELTVDNESQNETSTGVFFPDLIRQLMPFISQSQTASTEQINPSSVNFDTEHEGHPSVEQIERNNSHSRGTSHHRDNSSLTQEAKRQKRE